MFFLADKPVRKFNIPICLGTLYRHLPLPSGIKFKEPFSFRRRIRLSSLTEATLLVVPILINLRSLCEDNQDMFYPDYTNSSYEEVW